MLEYNSPVWSPFTKHMIEAIEAVQRSFTKRIPGLQNLTYGERLAKLNIQSLEHRRLMTDLTTCFNIVHGFSSLSFDDFFKFAANRFITRGHAFKLIIPLDKSNIRKYFFSSRVIKTWNSLPEEFVTSRNAKLFKTKINTFDFTSFLNFPCLCKYSKCISYLII